MTRRGRPQGGPDRGACQLAGTRELAARILNKQGANRPAPGFPGLAAASAGPDYATAIGL